MPMRDDPVELLKEILLDLGFAHPDGRLDHSRFAAAIRSRNKLTPEQWPDRRLERILGRSVTYEAQDIAYISAGLMINAKKLLWRRPPRFPARRPRSAYERLGEPTGTKYKL